MTHFGSRHDKGRWRGATQGGVPGGRSSPTCIPGSRRRWGRCGARTRGARSGRTCRASGCGFGRRCALHGGLRVGALWRGKASSEPRPTRRFVLITSGADIVSTAFHDKRDQRVWRLWALPEDLAALLPPAVLAASAEIGYVQTILVQCGVRRDVARNWPQALGYRIVLRLAERGRVAFALVTGQKDVMRAGRVRSTMRAAAVHRIEPDQLLQALRAAGTAVRREERR
jgi:hypothetical protein